MKKEPQVSYGGTPLPVAPSHTFRGERLDDPSVFPGTLEEKDIPPEPPFGEPPARRDPKEHRWDDNNDGINQMLWDAASVSNLPVIRQMVQEGAAINAGKPDHFYQWNALHRATYRGAQAAVELLLDLGADIAATDTWRKSPLHLAAELGRVQLCRFLLDRGADVNALNKNNQTALHYAAWDGYTSLCLLLLERGANPDIQDILPHGREGLTPLDYAMENSYADTIKVLNASTTLRSNYTRLLEDTGVSRRLRPFFESTETDASSSALRREEEVALSLTPEPSSSQ